MSQTTIDFNFRVNGTLTDVTAVTLSNAGGTFGVRRTDTLATVVADNTALTKNSTGRYAYTFTNPAEDITLNYWIEYVYGGNTFREEHNKYVPTSGGVEFDTLYTELASRLSDAAHGLWTLARKKAFINAAIEHWYELGGFTTATDSSVVTIANQVEYTAPDAIKNPSDIFLIELEEGTGEPYTPQTQWTATKTGITITLRFDATFTTASKKIRIHYITPFVQLVSDGDMTQVPSEFIYAFAKFRAHDEALGQVSEANRSFHETEAKRAFDVAMQIAQSQAMARKPQRASRAANS
jgi:hypothetical protein